jgi:pimeloyl-ACP methyl ester carboxylesterase
MNFANVSTNGIQLNVAQAGPAYGPLMILLHGFPEFWYGWHKHLPVLAQSGFRVWAPDQRGYNLSDKPPSIRDYAITQLMADVEGLIDAAGKTKALIVGHDWGGAVAWWLATHRPERVEKLVIINVPHPLVMRRLLSTSIRQLLRSWYVFAIQIPKLPEWRSSRDNWRDLVRGMQASSLPGTFSNADFDQYRQAWSQPRAYSSMLNWYRAALRYEIQKEKSNTKQVVVPTLVLWGTRDKFIAPEAAEMSRGMCQHGELIVFDDNTHWLQHERPTEICEHMIRFCQ